MPIIIIALHCIALYGRRCDNKDAMLSYDVCDELTVCRVDRLTS